MLRSLSCSQSVVEAKERGSVGKNKREKKCGDRVDFWGRIRGLLYGSERSFGLDVAKKF